MITRFDSDDAAALFDLSASVGWTHALEDWQTALEVGRIFGFRGEGRIQASAALYSYGNALASIGQVIVRAEARRQGLARALMLHCMDQAPDRPVMLVATPMGQPLYESLGFRVIELTYRFVSDAPLALTQAAACRARAMTVEDLPLAEAVDADAYGANRGQLLLTRWRQVCDAAILTDGAGFAFGTPRNIGPVIAHDAERAAQLVAFLAARQQVMLDVPERQEGFMRLLEQAGLRSLGPRALMLHGASTLPGNRAAVFGLASLAYG